MDKMMFCEYILIILLIFLGILMTYSDIRTGIIPNRWLLAFAGFGVLIDTIYYLFVRQNEVGVFAINFLAILLLVLILFYTNSLAGGDCKLIAAMALLYPSRMYFEYRGTAITLFVAVCFAILFGYFYLIISSGYRLFVGKNQLTRAFVREFLKNYFTSYFCALLYVMLINLVFVSIMKWFSNIPDGVIWIACMSAAWLSGRIKKFRNRIILLLAMIAVTVLSIINRTIPISLNPYSYAFTAFLIICQLTIRTNLYETIPTSETKKGMILSTFSSMKMQTSRVNGLPGLSSEDLSNRLSETEAESVRRWGKTGKGSPQIVIVKKIPFAVFITMGFAAYFLIWRFS